MNSIEFYGCNQRALKRMIVMTKYCNDKVLCNHVFFVLYNIVKFSYIYMCIFMLKFD